MIQIPYINLRAHLSAMMDRYDAFADEYNASIQVKRDSAENEAIRRTFQTLKPTHRALFKDLIIETGHNMLKHIRTSEKLQSEQANEGIIKLLRNPLVGDGFFVCTTNRYQIAKHNRKDKTTVYRNLNRLIEAGIISEKVNHGYKSDFELLINADFLIVSDRANPEYNPLTTSAKVAKCNQEEKEKEHLINKIYSDVPSVLNTTGSEANASQTGTSTGTGAAVNTVNDGFRAPERGFKPSGGAVDIQFLKADRGMDRVRLNKITNPAQWHAFHRLSFSAMFVDYMIEKIYNRMGTVIIPEARLRAIEYAEKAYFPSAETTAERFETPFFVCDSIADYSNRLNGLKWCVDAAFRYAARKRSYFMILNKYIDIQTVNGFINTLEWYKKAKFNEKEKARHAKNAADLRKLNELTRSVYENQTYESYITAEKFVENHLNKYLWVFRRQMATILNQVKPI